MKKLIKNKKLIIVGAAIVLLAIITTVLAGLIHRQSSDIEIAVNEENEAQCIWGARSDIDPSIGHDSLIYIDKTLKGSIIKYYSTDLKKSIAFCTRPNCRHVDSKCPAFFPASSSETPTEAAQIGRYVYCVYESGTDDNDLSDAERQLVRIDPYENTKEVVVSFKSVLSAGPNDSNEYVAEITNVNYCNGYLWCRLSLKKSDYYDKNGKGYSGMTRSVPCCINLETGEVNYFEEEGFEITYIMAFDPNHVVCYSAHYYDDVMPIEEAKKCRSMESFCEKAGIDTKDGYLPMSYDSYIVEYSKSHSGVARYTDINLLTGEKKVLFEENTIPISRRLGENILAYVPPTTIQGYYEGALVITEYIPDSSGGYNFNCFAVEKIDLETTETVKVWSGEDADVLWIAQGHSVNSVLANGVFFFVERNNESYDIMSYDLNTDKVSRLFTDSNNISFRLYGVWMGAYCGKLADEDDVFCWISFEDFQNGDLDNVVRYEWNKNRLF